MASSSVCAVPPWLLRSAAVSDSLHQLGSKSKIVPDLFSSKLNEILAVFDGYDHIFTDASKDGPAMTAAALSRLGTRVKRLPNEA
jgi:hypothetical protein